MPKFFVLLNDVSKNDLKTQSRTLRCTCSMDKMEVFNVSSRRRSSIAEALSSCTKSVHDAINVIKPALRHRGVCEELLRGHAEVNENFKVEFELQAKARLICEQQIASSDRKAAEISELLREKCRLDRCSENLEKRRCIYEGAKRDLRKARKPEQVKQQACSAIESITLKELKDLLLAMGDNEEKLRKPYHVTQYAIDAVSILLREAMPSVAETDVRIYMAEEKSDNMAEYLDSESDSSAWTLISENSDECGTTDREEGENNAEATPALDFYGADPVAMATRKHREAVGLKVSTERTHQQKSFLESLNTKKKSPLLSDTNQSESDAEETQGVGQEQKETFRLNNTTEVTAVKDLESEVKAYPRSKRQEVISEIGKEKWLKLSWVERLNHMHEYYPPGWQKREQLKSEFEAAYKTSDMGSSLSQETEDRFYKVETVPSDLVWLKSTCEIGCIFQESPKTFEKKYVRFGAKEKIVARVGLLARSRHRDFCKSLNSVLSLRDRDLVSLASNPELLELLEPYLEMRRMSGNAINVGPCGELGMALWKWLKCILDYAVVHPEHERLERRAKLQKKMFARAQKLFDEALERHEACARRLKEIKYDIRRLRWLGRKSLDELAAQRLTIKRRTKWPVCLRHIDAPPKFVVLVDELSRMSSKLSRYINELKIATGRQNKARNSEFLMRAAREECDCERRNVLNPWHWYMPDGIKWSRRCHNKWFVKGMRVGVGEDKLPGKIIKAWIHDQGRGKWADVTLDEGGIVAEVPHNQITMLYPNQVSFERALEDSQDKFVSTTFETSSQTPILLNVSVIVPRLKFHWRCKSMKYEDARSDLLRADDSRQDCAIRLIQCFIRCVMHKTSMKKVRFWRSTERVRAFRSQNRIKFKKMKHRNQVFATRLLERINAITNMQRLIRGHIARNSYKVIIARIAEEERERREKEEKRRQEIQISNQIRARAVQKKKVKNWRCPRCPLGVSFSQRFRDPAEIAAHMKIHEDDDAQKQRKMLAVEEKKDRERRERAKERLAKEKLALLKMQTLMEKRRAALEKAEREKNIRMKEKKVQKLTEAFTIKHQRPILPALRKERPQNHMEMRGQNMVSNRRHVNYALKHDGSPLIKSSPLKPPYPELRFVPNAMVKNSLRMKSSKMGTSRMLPEIVVITCTPFRLGRSRFSDMVIDSPDHPGLVSKDHAIIFVRGSPSTGYTLSLGDLHSTNGTFVNQMRVQPSSGAEFNRHNVELEDGALIVLGCIPREKSAVGMHLSNICYQLWKLGSRF